MANLDPVLQAGLSQASAAIKRLDLCSSEPKSLGDLASVSCGQTSIKVSAEKRYPTGYKIKVPPSNGLVTKGAKAAYWALSCETQVWACGELAEPTEIRSGNDFQLPAFDINFPGA